LEELHDGFRNHDPQGGHEKHYLTLLSGELSKGSQLVTLPLASQRLESGERMVQVDRHDGRAAHSEFELLEHIAGQSLVRVRIMTGRMHQIRVHAQSLGHPVLADRKYGERAANQAIRRYGLKRMFLHAERIRLQFQGGERIFAATLPKDLEHVLETLRNAS
jgi:23S rRNA pseudouridine955/2504/2580 synthase